MSDLLFRSLLTLAIGSLLSLPFISVREIGRGFFTLWAAIVGALGLLALALRSASGAGSLAASGPGDAVPKPDETGWFLVVCLALLAAFWLALRLGLPRAATAALLASALSGGFVLRELALHAMTATPTSATLLAAELPAASLPAAALRVSSLLLSALAVGMVTVAMVLGHWYLVQPKLALAPLRRCCDVFLGILLMRLVVSAWGVTESLRGGHRFLDGAEPIPWEALILAQRILFGFGGALLLAVMIRKTVALRSTMSATGLLYIAILFVWVGEFLSLYLGRLTAGRLVV